jgi:hypothetical protein
MISSNYHLNESSYAKAFAYELYLIIPDLLNSNFFNDIKNTRGSPKFVITGRAEKKVDDRDAHKVSHVQHAFYIQINLSAKQYK